MNVPQDSNSLIKEQKDILLGLYQEYCAHVRHYEVQRSTATNIIIAASVGLAGVMAYDYHLTHEDWPLTIALILVGLFGTVFTSIHFERIRFYERRAEEYLNELDALLFKGQASKSLTEILKTADHEPNDALLQKLKRLNNSRVFRIFWPLTIAMIGALLTGIVLFPLHK